MQLLSSPAPHNADPSQKQISDWTLLDLFDSSFKISENLTNNVVIPSTMELRA